MGRIKHGTFGEIFGEISGKVGPLVYSTWKGVSYTRAVAQNIHDPQTPGQMSHRSKFTLAVSIVSRMLPVVRIGFKLFANRRSAFNAAVSYMFANAVAGTYPAHTLDCTKMLISRGPLTPVQTGKAVAEGKVITVTWDDNSGKGSAKATDRCLALALNTETYESVYVIEGARRAEGVEKLTVPAHWEGKRVAVFLGFVSEDGEEVANGVYLGEVTGS